MGLFKRSAARGVAHALVANGAAEFPSKEAMDEAADAVGDAMPGPEVSPEGGHDPSLLAQVAEQLIAMGKALMSEGSTAAEAPPAPGVPPAPAPAPEEAKTAASRDLADAASEEALSVMNKVAAEVKSAGALIEGGDKGNTPEQAAQTNEVAKLDQKQRPAGAYQVAVGNTALDTNKGQLGASAKHDKSPANSPSGSNSLTRDAQKSAAYKVAVSKLAKSLLGVGGEGKNTPEAAAKTNDVAALDLKQRPKGKYVVTPGGANFKEPQSSRVGTEQPHPAAPSNSPSGTNSVIQASKSASELSSSDQALVELFKTAAADVGEFLPASMSSEEKVAEIRRMIGFNHDERQARLNELHAKHAGDLSEMVDAMKGTESKKDDDKSEKKDDDKSEKKDEKKDDEKDSKKESSLLAQLTEIANKASAK